MILKNYIFSKILEICHIFSIIFLITAFTYHYMHMCILIHNYMLTSSTITFLIASHSISR
jgi:hypothetical protein